MQIHPVDVAIIVGYLMLVVSVGMLLTRRASKNLGSYFLGDRSMSWYVLGVANASGMYDITGTMWQVTALFVYGLKSAWLPWLWPVFNQVFYMIFLAVWLRRSGVMTGAEWVRTRFGDSRGGALSHLIMVIFAIIACIGFLAYDFEGVAKFAAVFFPWDFSPNTYGVFFMTVTTCYVILGGVYSIVVTDFIQYGILTVASLCIGFTAMAKISPQALDAVVPAGWKELFFGWRLNLDWSNLIPAVNDKIRSDGWSVFGFFFMMMMFKGVLASMAGPPPNKDMQRMLSTRSPREASLMCLCTSLVLYIPRYMLITGVTVLALVFFSPQLRAMGTGFDVEQVLPYAIKDFIPVGVVGLILAGLLAAFMSTLNCTLNAGASYVINDLYKRYINPNASDRRFIVASYIGCIVLVAIGTVFGVMTKSIHSIMQWIVAGLYAGQLAPNILKWYWWRLNGFGFFAGMVTGIVAALIIGFPNAFPNLNPLLHGFPIILVLSSIASVLVSLLTKPDDEEILKSFYRKVRPWGFWKPVLKKVYAENPDFKPNTALKRDMVNVAVGVLWQLTLTLIPIYLVIKEYKSLAITVAILLATSVFLKKNWYDKLEDA